jgi:hypothetical protein
MEISKNEIVFLLNILFIIFPEDVHGIALKNNRVCLKKVLFLEAFNKLFF